MKRPRNRHPKNRRGNIIVLSALVMVLMAGVAATAVDLGYLATARTELQRSADAAALAAAIDLVEDGPLGGNVDLTEEIYNARATALKYGSLNVVGAASPAVDPNYSNDPGGDVVIGTLADSDAVMDFWDPNTYNAVRVRIRRTASQNGQVPLFFARVWGFDGIGAEAQATAMIRKNFSGFRAPPDGSNLEALPFAMAKQSWDNLMAGGGSDSWSWDSDTEQVSKGPDGVAEINLFPGGNITPGNFGTVDIGNNNNSTADLSRQITSGITQEDLDYMGGALELNETGQLLLNGDTGISAGIKDELEQIKGKSRILLLYDQVSGSGNNATFTIVGFVGVRIVEVNLTGKQSSKRVVIQPANIVTTGGIPNTTGQQTSTFVYSPAWLVQ